MLRGRFRPMKNVMATLTSIVAAATLLALAVTAVSCAQRAPTYRVELNRSSVVATLPAEIAESGECGSVVLRCSSVLAVGDTIVVETSRAKSLKAKNLVFLFPPQLADDDHILALVVSTLGSESEYDIGTATPYTLTRTSAEAAGRDHGISYQDWLNGAMSDSGSFPCCE